MYWYLSFLRPPPVSISTSSTSITITPQVANDLRTEVRYEPTEIHYTWQLVSPDPGKPLAGQHLTTYQSPESTYKALSISLPPSIRPGQKWRLGLFPSEAGPSRQRISNTLSQREDVDVIGVWSEAMEFIGPAGNGAERPAKKSKIEEKGKGKGKGKAKEVDDGPKQTRIHREWLTGEGDVETRLRIIEQTSFDLDKKIWDSGLALSAWLGQRLGRRAGTTAKSVARALEPLVGSSNGTTRVLEIGSGTGLVSIALRQILLRQSERYGDVEITATDLDSAMELMNENISLNEVAAGGPSETSAEDTTTLSPIVSLSAQTLDWDEALPDWVIENHPDLIIAADVTYNTASFASLVKTLCALIRPEGGARPPFFLAYKQRDEAERDLWKMLAEEGIELELVDKVPGAEEEGGVEIWVGTCSP